jgi:putative ABC transport system permease protein
VEPAFPFQYTFLDQQFGRVLADHVRFRAAIGYATLLTILIAVLGLFGLATFATERRRKEVGIRKVLGASVGQIVVGLNRSFLPPVALALLVALPLGYYVSSRWLRDFAYRIELSWWVFLLAAALAFGIALATVSVQSLRAAWRHPVDSLRGGGD